MADKIKISTGKLKQSYKPLILGSKSLSNRMLLINALASNKTLPLNLSDSDDTKRLNYYLNFIDICHKSRIPMIVDCGNAGTVMRFLTAYLCLKKGRWLLTGSKRMQERPIKDLVEALNELGFNLNYKNKNDYPPILVNPSVLEKNSVSVNPSKSSQYVTALLLIAPYLKGGLQINLTSKPVSESYIDMTINLMHDFGVDVERKANQLIIRENKYIKKPYFIEADWSSVAFWYQIVALNNNTSIEIEGLKEISLQGDSVLKNIFLDLGVKTEFTTTSAILSPLNTRKKSITVNAVNSPDIVPSLLSTCAALGIKAIITGVSHLKYKESDRLNAMKTELSKLGCKIEISDNEVVLFPERNLKPAEFDTYNDHRIAMSLAPLASEIGECVINKPDVVNKSYPSFWNHLMEVGYNISNNF